MVWLGLGQTVVHAFAIRKSALSFRSLQQFTTSKFSSSLHHKYIIIAKSREIARKAYIGHFGGKWKSGLVPKMLATTDALFNWSGRGIFIKKPTPMMNAQSWNAKIDTITDDFRKQFGSLRASELNWKPNPQTWSIAQNIDHLIVINKTYFDLIDRVRNNDFGHHWMAKFGFMVNFFGKFILKSVQPDRKNRMKTFPLWEPTSSQISADILEKFTQHQNALKDLIANCGDLLEKGMVISSPANKAIVYKLATAFDIIVAHERRHFQQALEIFQKLPK